MAKRNLQPEEAFDLRQALHVATLDALLSSRRWAPGELVFQGGTSLHLVHGSPRFSEDLDFLVNASLKLDALRGAVESRLGHLSWIPSDAQLAVSKAKDGHNPHSFSVSIAGVGLIGGVRVKVELWQADAAKAIAPLKVHVCPVRLAGGPAAGTQAFVPTADLSEIFVDKVFALAARPYLKPRDVFDLHWLRESAVPPTLSSADLAVRLSTYPNETADRWLAKAIMRRAELSVAQERVATDLERWLPTTWPMTPRAAQPMIDASIEALDQGMAKMRELSQTYGVVSDRRSERADADAEPPHGPER